MYSQQAKTSDNKNGYSPAASSGMGLGLQCKLDIDSVNDPLEAEADAMADRVIRMPDTPLVQRKCAGCEKEDKLQRKPLAASITPFIQTKGVEGGTASDAVTSQINATKDSGSNLNSNTKSFMESRFGTDFSDVKIHTGGDSIQMNRDLNAKAFTVGKDIYFNEGQYNPNSNDGKYLLAHELTHTVQQEKGIQKKIQKLSAANCAADCSVKDGVKTNTKKAKLIINADKESDFLTIPLKKEDGRKAWPVGHSWVSLISSLGDYWTYGFWPETGFDGAEPFKDVEGCVHHPDVAHKASSTQEYDLTDEEFDKAKNAAIAICTRKPKYNLYSNQCTSFVKDILAAVGKAPIGGFGLIWDSPNALSGWMDGSKKTVGIGYGFNTESFPSQSSGASLQGSYLYQFYSVLGNKLRFQWLNQGSLAFTSKSPSYLSSGLQMEFKPQQLVYLPDVYVFGSATGGTLSPFNPTQKWGVGFSAGAGLNYNIQNSLMLGFEYSVIKNLVQNDPVLNSLSLKVGFVFQ